ncbi:MAG: hypothetical protein R3242_09920 [Akkermansiaceae bacterium]|nr:hypothetical protein [Akkermansiaceae bacterium]
MRVVLSSICSLLLLGIAHASEIAAWKAPFIDLFGYDLEPGRLNVLESPPEKSIFFNEGDKLRALSDEQIKAHLPTNPALEWVVWNETTGRLITKSDWSGFLQLQAQLDLNPIYQVRNTIACHLVEDPAKPPVMDAKPLFQFSVLSRSGEQAELNWKQGDLALNFLIESTIGVDPNFIYTRLSGTAHHSEASRIHLGTAATSFGGEALWIARDYDGKSGLDFILRSEAEHLDGTPHHQSIQVQREGKAHSINTNSHTKTGTHKINETHWLMKIKLSLGTVHKLIDPNHYSGDQVDPFSTVEPDPPKPMEIPLIVPPDDLKEWLQKPVWDMSKVIKSSGIEVGDADFAGYEPQSGILYFYTNKELELDKMEQLFHSGCGHPRNTFATWDHHGQSGVLARSGEIATIARISKDGPSLRMFEFQPTVGGNDELVNLRLHAEDNSRPDQAFMLDGAYTLEVGQWKTVSEHQGPAGNEAARIKVDLIDIHDH